MKFGIVTAIWKRPALTRLALAHNAKAANVASRDLSNADKSWFDGVLVAVGSEGEESRKLVKECWPFGVYVETSNADLSAKWQAGVDAALAAGADSVMIVGSDDFATPELVKAAATAMQGGADVWGLEDFFFAGPGPRVIHWPGYAAESGRAGEPMGCCRTFSRRFIEKMKGRLWPNGLTSGLDGACWQRVLAAKEFFDVKIVTSPIVATGGMLVDVKRDGEEQMSAFQRYIDTGSDEVDAAPILAKFPPELVASWGLDPLPAFLARVRETMHVVDLPQPRPRRVGLAMIVKDSRDTVARAVRSAMPILDEAVMVVDDRTTDTQVHSGLGASLFFRKWVGFSAARNLAHELSEAEWQLVLDADETIDLGDLAEAIKRADAEDADAVLVTTLAQTEGGVVHHLQARVLRRGRTKWLYARQNELKGIKKSVVSTAIIRNSYVGRIKAIAEASIPEFLSMFENPSDPNATTDEERGHAATWLARTYMHVGNWTEAIVWAKKAKAILQPDDVKYAMAATSEMWASLYAGGQDEAEARAREILEEIGPVEDAHFMMGTLHLMKWYANGMSPGKFATLPQHSRAFLRNAPFAFECLGVGVGVREVDSEGEPK